MIYSFFDLIRHSLRRLLARKGTSLAAILGLTLAISLILSISLYANGVYFQSFLENIIKTRENTENTISAENPSFTFLFHFFGGWQGAKTWEELQPLDTYFARQGVRELDIPAIDLVRLFETDTFYFFPTAPDSPANTRYLARTSFGAMSNLDQHVTLVKGQFPAGNPPDADQPLEILVSETLFYRANLRLNETFESYFKVLTAAGTQETITIPATITGVWRPNDPGEDYWIFSPSYYESILFLPEETFFSRLHTLTEKFIHNAYWYLIMDAQYVHADEIGGLLNRIGRLDREANLRLDGLWLSISPREALGNFRDEARILRVLLYAFAIPVIGLAAAFVGLVSRLSTAQNRREIAVLRSRGASPIQLMGLTTLDGLLLGGLSLGLSIPFSMWITRFMGTARGFSNFSGASNVRVSLSGGTLQIGVFAVLVFLGMLLTPTQKATRETIISYKSDLARTRQKPWWQRAWLDLLLLIPAGYGSYLLQQQGSIAIINAENATDPFSNPLLFLVPTLGMLALSLFSLRLFGPLLTALDFLASQTASVGFTLAARNIARQTRNYYTPLLILTLTMSLFVYTAALMTTLDQSLFDQEHYRVGSDIKFFDPGDSSTTGDSYRWDFYPVSEYANNPEIAAATRFGRYAAQIQTARVDQKGLFFGIDRLTLPQTIYWRADFAADDLGTLMNVLAGDPANILVNRAFLQANGLQIGDSIRVNVKTNHIITELPLKIAAEIEMFPTWYPDQGPVVVGNLDHLFETAGGIFPYYVLLKTEPGSDPASIETRQLRALDQRIRPVDWTTAAKAIRAAQNAPERQGLIGFLFIGFVSAVVLTVLAFLLHLIFTFQNRAIEMSVLRASGLSTGQLIAALAWEFAALIGFGGITGTGLGLIASKIFIPYLQLNTGAESFYPPFLVQIPWDVISQIYWLFGILFTVSSIFSVILLRRMRIFEAIKLGETI